MKHLLSHFSASLLQFKGISNPRPLLSAPLLLLQGISNPRPLLKAPRPLLAALFLPFLFTTQAWAQGVVTITYDGPTATVEIPDSVSGVILTSGNSSSVNIFSTATSQEYTYRLTGTSSDGSFTLTGSYKLQLLLDGLTLTNAHSGAAIDIQCGKNVDVELAPGTVNTLCDAPGGSQKAAFYFKGHPEFKGGGTLNVTGRTAHAISAKEEMQLKPSLGTINILGAVKDGLHCGKDAQSADHNFFEMKGGTVNITGVQGDGIDAGDYGTIRILGGTLSVNVPDGATGIKADSIVSISGGTQNIVVAGNDAKGIRACYAVNMLGGQTSILVTGDGAKGIKGKCNTDTDATATVKNAGHVNIQGGNISITALGSDYTDPQTAEVAHCMGISVDGNLQHTDGSVLITAMGPEARIFNVKGAQTLQPATFVTRWLPWCFNAYDYQYDMSAYVAVSADGQLLSDYSQVVVAAFIGDDCVGYADFPTSDYGILRIHSNDLSAQPVTFRLYDYRAATEYALTPAQTVSFTVDAAVGRPAAPLLLSYSGAYLPGDVNLDGQVGIGDIIAITNVMAGTEGSDAAAVRADVNGDGEVGIGDIIAVTNIMATAD